MFQVKTTTGLLNYPSGKSAMVHYEFTENVRAAIACFASRHAETNSFVYRHLVEEDEAFNRDAVKSLHQQLTKRFVERFGCQPRTEELPVS